MNERILDALSAFGAADSLRIVCECRSLDCAARVDVPTAVFETVRPTGDRFLVVPGHESTGDRVVAAEETYAVVIERNGPQDAPPSAA